MTTSGIGGQWSSTSIDGKNADVFEPDGSGPYDRAVIYLHGHGEESLRSNDVFAAELARHRLPMICPRGRRSWWLDIVCSEFDESLTPMIFVRERVVAWIEAHWRVSPPGIGLLGISMGGQGALQLAYRYPRLFPVVAAISPAVDFQNLVGQGLPLDEMFADAEAARQQTATLHLHPLNWPRSQLLASDPADHFWHEGAERLASKLSSMGIPFECDLETSRGGHGWPYFEVMARRAVRFIAENLRPRIT